VATERETFQVPVTCWGPAAALDLPDRLALEPSPVGVRGAQVLLVRNVGQRAGEFALRARAPFSARPAQGRLAPGECLQVRA
jgi:hypothetical protein